MKFRTRFFALAIAVMATVAIGANAAHAEWFVSTGSHDYDGITVVASGTKCTIVTSSPVVDASSGVRMLKAVGTVSCERPVNLGWAVGQLRNTAEVPLYVKSAFGSSWYYGSQASLVMQTPCRNAVNTSYASSFEIHIDGDRNGVSDIGAIDLSVFSLRSCGI